MTTPAPQGWMARLSPEARQEFMVGMLNTMALSKQATASGSIGMMEVAVTDAFDASSVAAMLRANAGHVRDQVAAMEALAVQYDRLAEIADSAPPA